MCRLLITITLFCCSLTLEAADWPQFRGPGGQGNSASTDVPLFWDQKTNIAWKTAIPGNGWSSPVVSAGLAYVTTAVTAEEGNGDISLRVLCIDLADGTIVWDVEVGRLNTDVSIHPKNSHASPTPVVTNDRLYVHFASHGTAALDLQGNILWQRKIDYEPRHGSGSSPILYRDLLIFNCDGEQSPFVIALASESGQERWRTPRPPIAEMKFSFSTPLVIDVEGQKQLISPASDVVAAYDPANGEQLWMARYPQKWSVVPRPVYANGLVLICTGYDGPAELLAIRPDGTGDVTESSIAWRAARFIPHNPSPIIHNGNIYMVSDNGIASCRDLQSGSLKWKERLGGNYSASPIAAENRIYFLSENGMCTVIRAAPTFALLAKNDLQERSLASTVPIDGAMLIRTESGLYRIAE